MAKASVIICNRAHRNVISQSKEAAAERSPSASPRLHASTPPRAAARTLTFISSFHVSLAFRNSRVPKSKCVPTRKRISYENIFSPIKFEETDKFHSSYRLVVFLHFFRVFFVTLWSMILFMYLHEYSTLALATMFFVLV